VPADVDPALRALRSPRPADRAAAAAARGVGSRPPRGTAPALLALLDDPEPVVRRAALGAIVRVRAPATAARAWRRAAGDPDPGVRCRAAETAPALQQPPPVEQLTALLADADPFVAEAAAFALGELAPAAAVPDLATVATSHTDPLVRESAVAALGAIADPRGREAVLAACADRPAIRRRAVLALAAFDGDDVDAALRRALDDPDWQTRQAAEDVLGA
jgi:HEAT repeat protein